MKIWLITLLLWPVLAWGGTLNHTEPPQNNGAGAPELEAEQEDPNNLPISWADTSHAFATNQVQALTVWMDNFFGDPTYNLEQPDSLVRLAWQNSWDEEESFKARVRLRGKLQMPRISKRLNLLFSGTDGDNLGADERRENSDLVGVQYNVGELNRSRVDLTLDAGTWDLRPGIRYRNQGPISKQLGYRLTQRLEYKKSEGVYSTSEVYLDRVLNEDSLLRWDNQFIYGEESAGVEWRTLLFLSQRQRPLDKKHQLVVGYFGSIDGVTDPDYIKNYRVGMVFRRQVYRPFLFAELEPSYNWRLDSPDQHRSRAWSIVLRFELVLQRDLIRKWKKPSKSSKTQEIDPTATRLSPPDSTRAAAVDVQ